MSIMDIHFLGGASEVGRLGMLFRHQGAVMIFDYGFLPLDPPKYPMESPPVDMAFLSHAHLDHSGMIPWLAGRYDVNVVSTPATMATTDLLLEDSLKVTKLEGYPAPYEKDDLKAARRSFQTLEYGDAIDVGASEIALHSAGHIPGSSMFEINAGSTILFTGDLHTVNTELVWGAHPVKCDTLIIESTYAGRSHPERSQVERDFLAKIKEIVDRDGVAIVPCFAVARTQEILMTLSKSSFDVWLDGMGKEINKIYLHHPEYLRSLKKLKQAMSKTRVVRSEHRREKVLRGDVIVTTSGMLDGGPALTYIERLKDDEKSGVLLTGYQVEGTNGRMLLDQGVIDLHGNKVKVKCEVERFDFSSHAGHEDLVKFINECDPSRVVLMHGENREVLARAIEGREVLLPMEGQWYPI